MNKHIAIIEETETTISEKFGFTKLEYTGEIYPEKIDEKIKFFFADNPDIEKIIIPIKLGDEDIDNIGLKFGLHIRLTKDLKEKRFIPIIFTSPQTKETIVAQQVNSNKNLTASILFTKGTILTQGFNLDTIANEFNSVLNEKYYYEEVLPKLQVKNEREQGHQLANEWGVFRLAKFANCRLKSAKLPADLFFKYSFIKHDYAVQPVEKTKIGLQNKSIKALLIDDYAEKGWAELIEHILKSNFSFHKTALTTITTFDEASHFEKYEEQDLIFLDLRLTPNEDKKGELIPVEELSGMKLLKKIKAINRGIQVILLTASNKAWNITEMLKVGADGYFIKESPELKVDDKTSEDNYKNFLDTIDKCLSRNYLKKIYAGWEKAKTETANPDFDFIQESNPMLDIAWNLISQEQLDLGYLTLFQIIELYANRNYNYRDNSLTVDGERIYMIEDIEDQKLWKLTFNRDNQQGDYFSSGSKKQKKGINANTLFKTSCIFMFIFGKDDVFLKNFGQLNELRHKVAHSGARSFTTKKDIIDVLEVTGLLRKG